MTEKVYEMDDKYKQAVADLLEFIKLRDELAVSLKTNELDNLRERQKLLAEMNQQIEVCEAALAKEYDAYQTKCRTEEEFDEMSAEAEKRVEMVFIHIKHRHPEKLEEMKTALFAKWTPEEIEDFYDRVAIREAGDLISIIAREGETREQTEEFLKNYRAAQDKK